MSQQNSKSAGAATPQHHLYTNADKDCPDAICDRNGEVVLELCKQCGRGEIELQEPCDSGEESPGLK